jgi:hypothetical protein
MDSSSGSRRGYSPADNAIVQSMGMASSFMACLVLALYIDSAAASVGFAEPLLLWAMVPAMLSWQLRLWLSTARGQMHDDPIVFAAQDRISWLCSAAVLLSFTLASSAELGLTTVAAN